MYKDLLFVLIIIITVIVNIVKAIKKKAATGSGDVVAEESQPAGGEFQEILKKLMGDEYPKNTAQAARPAYETLETLEPMKENLEEQGLYSFKEPEYTKSSLSTTVFEVERSTSPLESKHYNIGAPLLQAEITAKNFDLRKGIIYDAILNRPRY